MKYFYWREQDVSKLDIYILWLHNPCSVDLFVSIFHSFEAGIVDEMFSFTSNVETCYNSSP